jgi:N-acetylglucosamine repressor
MRKVTQQLSKEHNRNLTLRTVVAHESVSRAEISRITKLTRSTVSDIVALLLAEGLVVEVGVGSSRGGKSPILLSLAADARHVIGLDLAHDRFSGAILNLRGKIRERVDLPVDGIDGDAALRLVYKVLDKLVRTASRPLLGIGVGTPGLVDTSRGVVVSAVNLNWRSLPLRQLLEDRYHLPVSVINDSQAAAIGEHTFGEGYTPESSLVVINVRHGIGAGIIVNGQVFHGAGGGAGEIGHIVVVREGGLPCRCGHTGCLETVASTRAVVERARMMARHAHESVLAESPDTIGFDSLQRAFAAGDPLARQVVLEAGRFLGLAVSVIVATLSIRKILIAGEMTRFGPALLESVKEGLAQTLFPRLIEETRVEFDRLGHDEIILGASALLLNDYSLLFTGQPARSKRAS